MSSHNVFLSHSHLDSAFCGRLVDYLRQALPSLDIFYDVRTLIGGDEWMRRIQHEVISRSTFVVVLSPNSVTSSWVREETNLALSEAMRNRQRRIIPVRHQECDVALLAALLLNRQVIDCATDESAGFRQLTDALQGADYTDQPKQQPAPKPDLHALTARIHLDYLAKQWDDVIRTGRIALQLMGDGQNGDTLGEVATALIETGKEDEGIRKLDAALTLQPARGDFWKLKARVMCQRPDGLAAALASWESAFAVTRDSRERWEVLAEEYAAIKPTSRFADMLRVVDDMLRLEPTRSQPWIYRGDALVLLKRPEEALQAYDRALAIDANNPHVLRERGKVLSSLGRFDEAVAVFERVLALDPNDESSWIAKARMLPE